MVNQLYQNQLKQVLKIWPFGYGWIYPETVNGGCLWGENLGNLRGRMEKDLHFSTYAVVLFKFLPRTRFT